jgi:hypothetical protein
VEKGKKDREYRSKPHYELGVTGEGDTVLVVTYLPP